ncbi:hypothetical protein [Tanticharoenia sakaeratensis]|uniref:Lipoprotein n=1 Tax=Tanticharoenia sakaeratensis NBRC 103193 TaxID=1231623 RepID=A0A0D6ML53_9PROT|nr:hypothetical protein [Tanticharoenia sakaeratensis]GAN54003.1 hypothetical protein Tasa_014_024 [Tanticharoenia sakaeratensis NBRC 103193]GBQ23088.1 hypothetical protein AA103193_2289 [Tanticharoenia sakaeratensis NBRC 103193]
MAGQRFAFCLIGATFLAGCADPTGPVFGDWYGYQSLPVPGGTKATELVLDGLPNAVSGGYRMHTQQYWPGPMMFNRSDYGGGRWVVRMTCRSPSWQEIDLIEGPFDGRRYVMLPNRMLIPAAIDGAGHVTGPDLTAFGLAQRLAARKPGTFGYGRA